MSRNTPSVALVVFTLVMVSVGFTQQASVTTVPNLVRYGGTLRDAQGAPIASATTGVTFAIYKQQDGGAPVWMETQTVALDANGNYSALLGSTTAAGLPSDLFSQEEQRWLGVQVQGQAEEPRVLLVSVPYAFKAHEAETLGGMSVSDFVLANGASSAASGSSAGQVSPSGVNNIPASNGTRKGAASDGPTNFSGSTTDQIVGVTQSGSGVGVNASAPSKGVVGTATATSGTVIGVEGGSAGSGGYGVYGNVSSSTGATVGVKGNSTSTAGTGVRGTNTATSGSTTGVSGYVASAAGVAAVFNNAAGGKIISGQNNGVENFSVDGLGNVNSTSGTYRIGGNRVLSIGSPADDNLFLGVGAGTSNVAGLGQFNTFSGYQAGYSNTKGYYNTFSGIAAGYNNTTGSYNTFSGSAAGLSNTTGSQNTFNGFAAGLSNITGSYNTFSGFQAGYSNTTGSNNTFSGWKAGFSNTLGQGNTFSGYQAGLNNTGDNLGEGDGSLNSFFGYQAGLSNTLGQGNTLSGYQAGYSNTEGSENTISGYQAGFSNSNGAENTFSGDYAGYNNTTGNQNTFSGDHAGYNNTTGCCNTFYGSSAGSSNTTGSSNVYIGSDGPSSGTESHTIRIGTQGAFNEEQNVAYIAGIYGSTVGGSGIAVYVDNNGQLGTVVSSLRFKEQVRDMGDSTSALMKLRPVTFLYKPEYSKGERTLQYGLIAEEVAQVYPELVAYDNDGQPYSVRYQYLSTMLLNEAQKQYRRAEAQAEVITTQGQKINELERRLSRLEALVGTRTNTAQLDPERTAIGAQ